jgi:hypothetical protein
MRRRALAVLFLAGSIGCRPGATEEPAGAAEEPAGATPEKPKAAPVPTAAGKKAYGAPISARPSEELRRVLEEPERYAGKELVVSGHVRRACSRMGCWIELAAGPDPQTPACRVMFHGHGFLVPTDSAGSDARVEGRLEVKAVSAGHAAHLEEEGARVPNKAADGSAREVRLLASGVELFRGG